MIPISDFQRRSLTGPVMKEQEFDIHFSRKMRAIVSRSGLKYDAEQIIADDARADATFAAAVDLLAEVGLYNRDTQRVIEFSKEEIEQLVQQDPLVVHGVVTEHTVHPWSVTIGGVGSA